MIISAEVALKISLQLWWHCHFYLIFTNCFEGINYQNQNNTINVSVKILARFLRKLRQKSVSNFPQSYCQHYPKLIRQQILLSMSNLKTYSLPACVPCATTIYQNICLLFYDLTTGAPNLSPVVIVP